MLACYFSPSGNCPCLLIACLLVFLVLNFSYFKLLSRIIDNKNKKRIIREEFARQKEEYFSKITESYNLIEASKISLGIYHDLANILTALNLVLYEVSNNLEDPLKLKKLIEQAECINQRANSLIKSFKHQCRREGIREVFSLSEETKKSLLMLNFSFIKNKIELDLKIKENVNIFGDAIRFGQALINLISNAVESFSDDSFSRKIFLVLETSGDNIFISVQDNGRGISFDSLKNIFNPFFSLKKKDFSDLNNEHCGIGLSLAKKIIEDEFSGKILVESVLGQGSKFTIILPNKVSK
ncbi:MAG: HAMP domain-containing sensor histidine kinase [Patescibacteria group bacterium]|nr:HAMP domain-containing sensor histidine kinase [Patescibacteria group bacterium]